MNNNNLNIGLIGLGTVGRGLVNQIHTNGNKLSQSLGVNFTISKAIVANTSKKRELPIEIPVSSDPSFVLDDPSIDVIVELAGGLELPGMAAQKCLERKIPFITANKYFLAENAGTIFNQFAEKNLFLGLEASVCGGIPIISTIRDGFAGDSIHLIRGIMNGTSNFILSQMAQNSTDYDDELKEAQRLGFAEADPTFDVEGVDAAHKLIILSYLAFGVIIPTNELYIDGITNLTALDILFANEMGYSIKSIAQSSLKDGIVEASVRPTLVKKDHVLAEINGSMNAVEVESEFIGDYLAYGPGAGSYPTANSVMSDLISFVRGANSYKSFSTRNNSYRKETGKKNEFFISLIVKDQLGVLKKISEILFLNGISVHQVIQKDSKNSEDVYMYLLTHEVEENKIREAMSLVKKLEFIVGIPKYLIIAKD